MRTTISLRMWARSSLFLTCLIVITVHSFIIAHRRANHIGDFDINREFGRRFLMGEHLYDGGLLYNYFPSAAMYYSPLAFVPANVAFAFRYAGALACLWIIFSLLHRMVQKYVEPTRGNLIMCIFTILLGFQYILRDLDDGGPHLILLAMLVGGIYCVWKGREKLGAMWFGVTIALKVTPALFLPFFIWKRQWRLAAYTTLAAAFWILVPILWMGPVSWWDHHKEWVNVSAASFVGQKTEAIRQDQARIQNQSLLPALKGYLHHLPSSNGSDISLLNSPPATATIVAITMIIGLFAFFGWTVRQRYRSQNDPAWLEECSSVLILALLLSPITWLQHMVWLVPGLYLIVVTALGPKKLGKPTLVAMGFYILFALILNREFLGKQNMILLLGYYTHTIAMLLILGILTFQRPLADTSP